MKNIYKNLVPLEEKNKFLRIEMYYSLGGMNYFTSRVEPRGYYVSATPVERKEMDGITMESVTAFSGLKRCILECARQSKKREAEALALMTDSLQEIAAAVLERNGLRTGGAA